MITEDIERIAKLSDEELIKEAKSILLTVDGKGKELKDCFLTEILDRWRWAEQDLDQHIGPER